MKESNKQCTKRISTASVVDNPKLYSTPVSTDKDLKLAHMAGYSLILIVLIMAVIA